MKPRVRGNNTFESANSIHSIGRILAALKEHGPMTYLEMEEVLHMTARSVRRYIAHLREKPNRRVSVTRFKKVPNNHSPVFALGDRKDALPPPKQTQAQRSAAWRSLTPTYWQRLRAVPLHSTPAPTR